MIKPTPEQELERVQAKITQCNTDIDGIMRSRGTHEKNVAELKAKIEAAKVTYSIGDRFELEGSNHLLASTGYNQVSMIIMDNGERWEDVTVADIHNITPAEFKKICCGNSFTRKQEYTGEKITEFEHENGVFMPVKVGINVSGHGIRMEQKDGQVIMLSIDSTPELLSQLTKMLR